MRANHLDEAIDRLAQRQHGAFSRAQAGHAGASPKMIRVRIANGRWLPVAPSVFVLPSHPQVWIQRVMVAVLTADRAVASGLTAAALHGLVSFVGGRPEITVPRGRHHGQVGPLVRQSNLVEPVRIQGVPTNSAALTLIELAGRVPRSVLESALESGLRTGSLRLSPLGRHLARLRESRRPGLRVLEAMVGERIGGGAPSASELERIFYETFDRPELSPFERQPRLPWSTTGERGDGLVVPSRLLLEADGRPWHEQLTAMANDRRRDRLAVAHQLKPLRFTWAELNDQPGVLRSEVIGIHQLAVAAPAA
jgi:hypothetical protein